MLIMLITFIAELLGEASNLDAGLTVRLYVYTVIWEINATVLLML